MATIDIPWFGTVTAVLTDLCADGASVEVPGFDLPARLERLIVRLSIDSPRRGARFATEALVVREVAVGESRRLGLRFRDTDRLFEQLESREFRLFNRRHERRVPPSSEARLPIVIDPEGLALKVLVRDISRDGVGFLVDDQGRAAIEGWHECEALLRLPRETRPLGCRLELRHVSSLSKGNLFGAVFVPERRRAHALLRARIGDYGRARRVELTRWDGLIA